MASDGTKRPGAIVARRVAWEESVLVEGTEALLWPASSEEEAAEGPFLPASDGVGAVLSWASSKVLRFQTASPQPLAQLLLVSTLAVGGPARFVVHKTYQLGSTAVCDPPRELYLLERRELFRVVVAAPVSVLTGGAKFSVHSLDCSSGGVRVYLPAPLDLGREVAIELGIGEHEPLEAAAAVRHCKQVGEEVWAAGLEFVNLAAGPTRKLSQFIALQERRLMPRVGSVTLVEYRSHGRTRLRDGLAKELSPGALVLGLHEVHVPGDAIEVSLRLGRKSFTFQGRVVACVPVVEDAQATARHKVTVCLDQQGRAGEEEFRRAVRDLALENLASSSP